MISKIAIVTWCVLVATVSASPSLVHKKPKPDLEKGTCTSHDVEDLNVRVCRFKSKHVRILPLFAYEHLQAEPVKTNEYLNTKTRDHRIRLTSEKVRQAVANMKEYKGDKVDFVELEGVRFVNINQNILDRRTQCSKLCPCFIFSDEEVDIQEVDSDQFATITLVATQPDNRCFSRVSFKQIEGVVQAEYRVNKEKEIFHSGLQVHSVSYEVLVQQRLDGSLSFDKSWVEYENGFGGESNDYWIGLKKLHQLTSTGMFYVRFEMLPHDSEEWLWAEYKTFVVGPSSDKYRLTIGDYNEDSTAGDSITNPSYSRVDNLNNQQFSTIDQENDSQQWYACSESFGHGGFWFNGCMLANPNGRWSDTETKDHHEYMIWYSARHSAGSGHSMKQFRIKLIPL